MNTGIYRLVQWTFGLPQTLLGSAVFFRHRHCRQGEFHGAHVTYWEKRTGLSLGMFLFLPENEAAASFLIEHEYGHSLQSLMLGPLYLLVIGLPSILWCRLPYFQEYRRKRRVSYYHFYPEKWANHLAKKMLKK